MEDNIIQKNGVTYKKIESPFGFNHYFRITKPKNLQKTNRTVKPLKRSKRRIWKDKNGEKWVKIDGYWFTSKGIDY